MVTASNHLSVPIDNLRGLISESSTFQAWVNADDATAALDRVYVEGVPGADDYEDIDISSLRPFAMVTLDSSADGLIQYFGGSLQMMFESDISEENRKNFKDASYEFTNTVGGILQDIRNASYGGGKLFIRTIESIGRPARSDPKEDGGQYMQQWFRVSYGLEVI